MAPSNKASPYYYELCDKTHVPNAILQDHRARAIHRGLLGALFKMTGHQLQVFREDLKIDRHKQKLSAKRAILKALRKPLEPKNWCVPFFFSTMFCRVFPPPFIIIIIFI
jgi:hypothetical protein